MTIVIFWTLILLILYCYFGYPLILKILALYAQRPIQKRSFEPSLTVVISVYNEENVIEQKIRNLLSLDYPPEKIEIWIGSDGSDDRTNPYVQNIQDPRVHLLASPKRRGKMATLNDLIQHVRSEVIVFADARQMFARDALRQLVANFADPVVGCVSGELMFSSKEGATAKGVNFYWNYEKKIRKLESQIHSMLGATGAIYAIRRELYTPIPPNVVLDDMYVPLKIVEKGFRAVFDETAKAYDEVADSPREEHRRKARTLFGNYQLFFLLPQLFNPFQSPVAIQLFSHKFLRVIIPFFMIAIFILNIFLTHDALYNFIFKLQILFYGMAALGALLRHTKYVILKPISKLCAVPYVFCLLNFSALMGFIRFATMQQKVTWTKAKN
jgi:cellulose synthase/poly-beta-1,6-N-acetylglucosamine synthase-like glycosyltransferase